MKRLLLGTVAVVALLVVGIGWKLRAQGEAIEGPARGSGVVEGTQIDLSARISARVVELGAVEGTQVEASSLVVRLDCAEPEAILAEARARLDAVRSEAAAVEERASAAGRLRLAARASTRAAAARTRALSEQRDLARRDADRVDEVGRHAPASSRDRTRAAAERLAREVEAAEQAQRASALQASASDAEGRAARVGAEAATHQTRALEAAVHRAQLMVDECTIHAPRDAWVDRVFYEIGELAPPGAVLLRLVALEEVRVTFYLPNAELASARVGSPALVEADAWPGKTFEGRVTSVGAEAEFTPRNIQTRTDRDRLVYPITVRVANPDMQLRPGMPVEVTLPGTDAPQTEQP